MTAPGRASGKSPAPVRLHDLIDVAEAQCDTVLHYLNLESGEICTVSEEAFYLAGEGTAECDRIPQWQQEEVERAKRISASDHYVVLPASWDIHEWAIVEQFCSSVSDTEVASQLLAAIHGRGAFRRFKDQLAQHSLWESWNEFRHSAIRHLVVEWCEAHAIPYVA